MAAMQPVPAAVTASLTNRPFLDQLSFMRSIHA